MILLIVICHSWILYFDSFLRWLDFILTERAHNAILFEFSLAHSTAFTPAELNYFFFRIGCYRIHTLHMLIPSSLPFCLLSGELPILYDSAKYHLLLSPFLTSWYRADSSPLWCAFGLFCFVLLLLDLNDQSLLSLLQNYSKP